MTQEQILKSHAAEIGFDLCRIVRVDEAWAAGDGLAAFVEADHHGDMQWMADTLERRKHPNGMWPEAKSGIVVGLNYGPDLDPLLSLEKTSMATISVYASGRDYHDVLKKKLKRLARAFAETTGEDVKVFVDTAPLMEKPLAAKAGLGWQGKHTNLVSQEFGSWLFLGVMLTTADLLPDASETDHCGSCRACLDICPTDAFPAPYKLDARRCISYLTIEHKGPIPHALRAAMGNRIYGCDDCLAVCPWNKFAEVSNEAKFHARELTTSPALSRLVQLEDGAFRTLYSGSPIKRIGIDRFLRNVLIAIGNSGDLSLIPLVVARLTHTNPLVRGAAVWALSQLDRETFRTQESIHEQRESDKSVKAEWAAGALA